MNNRRPVHELTTWRNADQVDAEVARQRAEEDWNEPRLTWRIGEQEALRMKYQAGDLVTVKTTGDFAVYIGHIDEVDDDELKIYVILD